MKTSKEYLEIESNNIIFFFSNFSRAKLISVSTVEKLSNVPKNTLLNLLTVNRIIPIKHIKQITDTLTCVGFERLFDWQEVFEQIEKGVFE